MTWGYERGCGTGASKEYGSAGEGERYPGRSTGRTQRAGAGALRSSASSPRVWSAP